MQCITGMIYSYADSSYSLYKHSGYPTLVEPSKEIWLGFDNALFGYGANGYVRVLWGESRIVLLGPVVYLIIEDNF